MIATYFILSLFSANKGRRLLGLSLLTVSALVAASYFGLSGFRLLAQGAIILLIVTIPVIFHQEWSQYLETKTKVLSGLNRPIRWIVSLVLGLLLVVLASGVSTRTAVLPEKILLKAVNEQTGLTANFGSVNSVEVIVSAPRDKWSSLSAESFSAVVDVKDLAVGNYDLGVLLSSKVENVSVRRIRPAKVVVAIEPVISKTVAVSVKYTGTAGNELVPDLPKLSLDKVELSGPKSVVSTLTQAYVIIDLSAKTANFEQVAKLTALNNLNEQIGSVTFNPLEITVNTSLIKAGKVKTLSIVPNITGQPANGFWVSEIQINPTTVVVTGSAEVLEKIKNISTLPVNIEGITGNKELDATLDLPSGVTLAQETGKIKVALTLKDNETTKQILPTINYTNVNGSLKVTSISPTSVTVLVAGGATALATAGNGSAINLDLAAYKSAGTYSVPIPSTAIQLSSGITLVSFLPSAIDVILDNR